MLKCRRPFFLCVCVCVSHDIEEWLNELLGKQEHSICLYTCESVSLSLFPCLPPYCPPPPPPPLLCDVNITTAILRNPAGSGFPDFSGTDTGSWSAESLIDPSGGHSTMPPHCLFIASRPAAGCSPLPASRDTWALLLMHYSVRVWYFSCRARHPPSFPWLAALHNLPVTVVVSVVGWRDINVQRKSPRC